jgi:hypothetical protein
MPAARSPTGRWHDRAILLRVRLRRLRAIRSQC